MAIARAAQKARKKSTSENRKQLAALKEKIETLPLFSEMETDPSSDSTAASPPRSAPSRPDPARPGAGRPGGDK